MIKTITPNRAILFAVGAFVFYWIAALFVPAAILRDVFNALAFGAAVIIAITWAPAAWRGLREGGDTGEWQLILAVFIIWCVVMTQRVYIGLFNYLGRPEGWSTSPITGFWPYSFMIAGSLFIIAPGVKADGFRSRAVWSLVAAGAIGGLVAGIMIGASISTV